MNLFFRFWTIFLRARLFGAKNADLSPQTLNFRVWFTDQDMFLHMTNSRYVSFADLGHIDYLIRAGFHRVIKRHKWSWELRAQSVDVLRMLKAPQKFELVTEICGWTDTYICFRHKFLSQNREHARVRTIMQIDNSAGATVPVNELMGASGQVKASPQIPEPFLRMIDDLSEA